MSRGLGDSSPIYGIIYEIKWRHDGTPCNPSVKENEGWLLIDEESWYWFVADGQWWRSGWDGAWVMASVFGSSSLGREQRSWRWRSAAWKWKEFSWLNWSFISLVCLSSGNYLHLQEELNVYWNQTNYFTIRIFIPYLFMLLMLLM